MLTKFENEVALAPASIDPASKATENQNQRKLPSRRALVIIPKQRRQA
jgi:hypothetical protein